VGNTFARIGFFVSEWNSYIKNIQDYRTEVNLILESDISLGWLRTKKIGLIKSFMIFSLGESGNRTTIQNRLQELIRSLPEVERKGSSSFKTTNPSH